MNRSREIDDLLLAYDSTGLQVRRYCFIHVAKLRIAHIHVTLPDGENTA
jgi:hypothetical protein